MRGEHSKQDDEPTLDWGSSPHARGARPGLVDAHPYLGIIPACAGSTNSVKHFLTSEWDHPRMRGEHPNSRS